VLGQSYTRRMPICRRCRQDNPKGAKFCNECGAPLPLVASPREQRKVVTVLFCDVTGSTELGERLDPEPLRALLARYFERMKQIVERHGGTVEKFIGDAVMAVFGLPTLHEDDALRAVRAAVEMRQALPELGIEGRIGMTTGEVVAGTEERLATGDAVNVAARLEQAAMPGEVLIGEQTMRLTRNRIRAESVTPLALKGKSEPLPAWRLLEVLDDVPAQMRGTEMLFVGRERELKLLRDVFEATCAESACRLVTVLGDPGIGKSRLVREFVASAGERSRVLIGRCVPYGEGITYRPLAEIVREVAGRPSLGQLLARDASAGLIARILASAVGSTERTGSSEETQWAVRRLFEALARDGPLIVVLEDLHWAEPAFLDLVEYILGFGAEGAILLIALTRPDLLETRPTWAVAGPKSHLLHLEPLDESEINTLIVRSAGTDELGEAMRARIVEVAEGNPLFVVQMLAMHADGFGGELDVPLTIQALLAARIDRLDDGERDVIERASIEGRAFHQGAVVKLLPAAERAETEAHLVALVRKGLIRPDRAEFLGEEGFRFAHILIRDAAYNSLPKRLRSELHERFAIWLEEKAGNQTPGYEEIAGYHLEQAYRYRTELGPIDDGALELASQASKRLLAASGRARARADHPATVTLLDRTLSLIRPNDPQRGEILGQLGWTLGWTERVRSEAVLTEALNVARRRGDRRLELLASLRRAYVRSLMEPEGTRDEILRLTEQAMPVFEQLGDELGLTEVWRDVAYAHKAAGRFGPEVEALGRALAHARRAGAWREENEILAVRLSRLITGPSPLSEAVRAYKEVLDQVGDDLPLQGEVSIRFAWAEVMRERIDDAYALDKRGWTILDELGLAETHAVLSHYSGSTYLLAGDPAAAERRLRWGFRVLAGGAEKAVRSLVAALLAEALYLQGRLDECERFVVISRKTAASDDAWSQTQCDSVGAKVLARRGETDRAEELARLAVARAEDTDSPELRGNALLDQAEVLTIAGRSADAPPMVERALRLYDVKGNRASARKARGRLWELRQSNSHRV
jgi:class 3 adenylate cyclase/tetratricopeptide (TPR) repeat protein